jgi:hypothetical protein
MTHVESAFGERITVEMVEKARVMAEVTSTSTSAAAPRPL